MNDFITFFKGLLKFCFLPAFINALILIILFDIIMALGGHEQKEHFFVQFFNWYFGVDEE